MQWPFKIASPSLSPRNVNQQCGILWKQSRWLLHAKWHPYWFTYDQNNNASSLFLHYSHSQHSIFRRGTYEIVSIEPSLMKLMDVQTKDTKGPTYLLTCCTKSGKYIILGVNDRTDGEAWIRTLYGHSTRKCITPNHEMEDNITSNGNEKIQRSMSSPLELQVMTDQPISTPRVMAEQQISSPQVTAEQPVSSPQVTSEHLVSSPEPRVITDQSMLSPQVTDEQPIRRLHEDTSHTLQQDLDDLRSELRIQEQDGPEMGGNGDILHNKYQVLGELGSGATSVVNLCQLLGDNHDENNNRKEDNEEDRSP